MTICLNLMGALLIFILGYAVHAVLRSWSANGEIVVVEEEFYMNISHEELDKLLHDSKSYDSIIFTIRKRKTPHNR